MFEKVKRLFKRSDMVTLDALLSNHYSGEMVTISKEQALNIPAVYTAVEFISSTIAALPIKMYKYDNENNAVEVTDDYRLQMLNEETGDLLDAVQFKKAIIKDMLLDGAGYAYIERKRNQISGLYYIEPIYINVIDGIDKIKKSVEISIDAQPIHDFELFRLTKDTTNGVTGRGLLKTNPVLLNAMYNSLKYENVAVSSGTKRGFLKSKYKLDESMLSKLKDAWRKLYSTDVNNTPDVMVLNEGITFEPSSSTATENQLNESKQTNSKLIYEWFGLSESLFDGTKGNRDAYINNVKTGVLPIVEAFNTALNKFLLLEREKGNLFFMIDASPILQSTIIERFNAYHQAIEDGWILLDEVRLLENLSPLGLDFVKLSLGNIFYYPKNKKVYTPNTNQMADMNEQSTVNNASNGTQGTKDNVHDESIMDEKNAPKNENNKV